LTAMTSAILETGLALNWSSLVRYGSRSLTPEIVLRPGGPVEWSRLQDAGDYHSASVPNARWGWLALPPSWGITGRIYWWWILRPQVRRSPRCESPCPACAGSIQERSTRSSNRRLDGHEAEIPTRTAGGSSDSRNRRHSPGGRRHPWPEGD